MHQSRTRSIFTTKTRLAAILKIGAVVAAYEEKDVEVVLVIPLDDATLERVANS